MAVRLLRMLPASVASLRHLRFDIARNSSNSDPGRDVEQETVKETAILEGKLYCSLFS